MLAGLNRPEMMDGDGDVDEGGGGGRGTCMLMSPTCNALDEQVMAQKVVAASSSQQLPWRIVKPWRLWPDFNPSP